MLKENCLTNSILMLKVLLNEAQRNEYSLCPVVAEAIRTILGVHHTNTLIVYNRGKATISNDNTTSNL
ncbi:unnamed protein product [Rotaria sordida]|uniref:Uncharacterized protein n=1 Tax=Rotaria sordida TaxID=392033 RepID=A0A819FAZ9_9BILA|nr:unnamed protein product [Rotaria sordida]